MSTLVYLIDNEYSYIYDDDELKQTSFINDERNVFIRKDGRIVTPCGVQIAVPDKCNIIPILQLPLSMYIKLHLTQKVSLTCNTVKDHPLCIAVQMENPEKKFKRIIKKMQDAMPEYFYIPSKDMNVYNRFRVLTDPKEFNKLAKIAFDPTWLITSTYFLVHLYEAYKSSRKFGHLYSECQWIACDGIKTVLQLLMTYPASDYSLFLNKARTLQDLELSQDNINSVYYVVDTYNLDDGAISEFMCFCINKGIRCDVVISLDSLWENERMNVVFMNKNFISVISVCFNNRKFIEILDPIFIQMCHRWPMCNKQIQSFVQKTTEDKLLVKQNVRFRAKHILKYFGDSKNIVKYAIPILELMGIELNGSQTTIFEAMSQVRANQALIMFLVHNFAVMNHRGKHHGIFSNLDILCMVAEYMGVTKHYVSLLHDMRRNTQKYIK